MSAFQKRQKELLGGLQRGLFSLPWDVCESFEEEVQHATTIEQLDAIRERIRNAEEEIKTGEEY